MTKTEMQINDRMTYDEIDGLDDMERDSLYADLRQRDLRLADDGCGCVVVWMYRQDGSRIEPSSPPCDEETRAEQPQQ